MKPHKEDIDQLSEKLSSKKAKKAFLLTLATMALADQVIDPSEKKMLDQLTKNLDVGKVKLNNLTFQECEDMVMKLISSADLPREPIKKEVKEPKSTTTKQMSDIDILMR